VKPSAGGVRRTTSDPGTESIIAMRLSSPATAARNVESEQRAIAAATG
jgi:hypothetical protein